MQHPAETSPDKSRKRQKYQNQWKRALNKQKRYAAKNLPEYPKCKHNTKSYKCSTLLMRDINEFHRGFYAHKNKLLQDSYILRYCTVDKIKRTRKTGNSTRSRTMAITYGIKQALSADVVPVCKSTFLKILDLSKHRIEGVMRRFLDKGEMPVENRGGDRIGHKNVNKRSGVIKFIKSFTIIESHYCRGKSARQYLSSELNIKKIWRMYNNQADSKLKVKECYFRNIFNTKFNLGFNAPQTDVCSRCLELKERIKHAPEDDTKQTLQTEQRIHKLRAKAFFQCLEESDPSVITMSYDCEKNLVLPKIPDQQTYYKRQLYVYNFTIVVGSSHSKLSKDNVFIYTWKESERPKGSNEIASAVFDRMQKLELGGISEIRLCADGCGGQNKNSIVLTMASAWLQRAPVNIKTVQLVFPVTGHSYIPPDRVFANIEKRIRKKDTIIKEEEYYEIFEESGTIQRLGVDWNVYDWKTESSLYTKTTGSLHFQINSCKRIILTRNTKGNVLVQGEPFYKHSINVAKGITKKGKSISQINPDKMDIGKVVVKAAKIQNVAELLQGHFGNEWNSQAEMLGLQYYKEVIDRHRNAPNQPEEEEEILCQEQVDDNRMV